MAGKKETRADENKKDQLRFDEQESLNSQTEVKAICLEQNENNCSQQPCQAISGHDLATCGTSSSSETSSSYLEVNLRRTGESLNSQTEVKAICFEQNESNCSQQPCQAISGHDLATCGTSSSSETSSSYLEVNLHRTGESLNSQTEVKAICLEQNESNCSQQPCQAISGRDLATCGTSSSSETSSSYLEVNSRRTGESFRSRAIGGPMSQGQDVNSNLKCLTTDGLTSLETSIFNLHPIKSDENFFHRQSVYSNIYESVDFLDKRPSKTCKNKTIIMAVIAVVFVFLMVICSTSLATGFFVKNQLLTIINAPKTDSNGTKSNNSTYSYDELNTSDGFTQNTKIQRSSHYISYVNIEFIRKHFGYFYLEHITRSCMEIPMWHGILCRNRTLQITDISSGLNFFKETDDRVGTALDDHERALDFSESSSLFYVRYAGLYTVYATVQIGKKYHRDVVYLVHKREHQVLQQYDGIKYDSREQFLPNLISLNIIIFLREGDTLSLFSGFKNTTIDLTYGVTFFGVYSIDM